MPLHQERRVVRLARGRVARLDRGRVVRLDRGRVVRLTEELKTAASQRIRARW